MHEDEARCKYCYEESTQFQDEYVCDNCEMYYSELREERLVAIQVRLEKVRNKQKSNKLVNWING